MRNVRPGADVSSDVPRAAQANKFPIKKWDWVVIGVAVLLSLLPLLQALQPGADVQVHVTVRGETVYSGPLTEDAMIEAGPSNTVTIENGVVRMTRADCPDGLCLHGTAQAAHPLVCLPNEVVVTLTRGEEGYDALSY